MIRIIYLSALCFWQSAFAATIKHDPVAVHGMLVFGEKEIFLSHLPMFHSPHDYQAIVRVKIDKKSHAAYLLEKRKNSNEIFTLVPNEIFILPDQINWKKSFSASLYRGHFERGGEKISEFLVEIEDVLLFQKLEEKQFQDGSSYYYLKYGMEEFLIHKIMQKPSFDQVLEVKNIGGDKKEDFLFLTLELVGAKNRPITSGLFQAYVAGGIEMTRIRVEREVYLELGDLSH
ncbi:MAG: hypothetical protein M9962_07685 [Oligoflexia bacterium]|nr:hypothetical protein [Oligoflexia bacterium]